MSCGALIFSYLGCDCFSANVHDEFSVLVFEGGGGGVLFHLHHINSFPSVHHLSLWLFLSYRFVPSQRATIYWHPSPSAPSCPTFFLSLLKNNLPLHSPEVVRYGNSPHRLLIPAPTSKATGLLRCTRRHVKYQWRAYEDVSTCAQSNTYLRIWQQTARRGRPP